MARLFQHIIMASSLHINVNEYHSLCSMSFKVGFLVPTLISEVIHKITGAQNQINTLANCNHDEHDKIWNWIEQRLQIWRKIEFSPSPFRVTSQTAQPIQPSKAGSAGTVSLATLKGLGENSIFLQICNLYTIQFHILLCSSWLQFARVLIPF